MQGFARYLFASGQNRLNIAQLHSRYTSIRPTNHPSHYLANQISILEHQSISLSLLYLLNDNLLSGLRTNPPNLIIP
jgi:hypothetical protein